MGHHGRLQTINESLQMHGAMKGVYGNLSFQVYLDDADEIKTSVGFNVQELRAQLNESVSRVTEDKLGMFKKDVHAVVNDANKRIEQLIDKYNFGK